MIIKRITAFLVIALLVSFTFVSYASSFTDVADDYWAKDYIEEMSSIGLIKGYPDGTFMPSKAVSKWECLLLAARVLGFNKPENSEFIKMASENYIPFLNKFNVSNKEEIAYLMYWDVLDSSDLSEYLSDENKNKPQLRYEAAVLLTKVAGGEHEALNQMLLDTDYSDAGQIPASAKPYVAYATKKKIMQGTGESKFEPLLQVSRAQMATMMFNTLRAINFTIVDATVQSTVSSNKSINVIQKDNVATKYTLSDNTLIRLDGKRADFDALIQGMSVRIYLQEGSVRMVEGVSTFETLVAEGKVIDTGTKQGGDYITIELEDEEGKAFNKTFSVAPNAVITLDGAKVYLSSLKNQYAKVYYNENETSYKIEAENRIKNAYGTLYELVIDPPSIIIKTSNDELQTYYLLDNVSVVRDGLSAVLRDLVVGDRLDLTLEYGKVKSIRATSISDSKEGIIKTLTFSDTNEITVKIGEETLTYNITPNTLIYVDDQPASMYDLRVGAKAKIYTESNNITKIYTSEVIGPSQITGVVKNINTNYYIITLEEIGTGSGEQKVAVKRNCVIVDNTGRNITTFSKIPKGSTIVCFGDMNSGIYEVNTIIITN